MAVLSISTVNQFIFPNEMHMTRCEWTTAESCQKSRTAQWTGCLVYLPCCNLCTARDDLL